MNNNTTEYKKLEKELLQARREIRAKIKDLKSQIEVYKKQLDALTPGKKQKRPNPWKGKRSEVICGDRGALQIFTY